MAKANTPAFDNVGDQFIDYYATVRGRIREHITRQNVAAALPKTPQRIVDIGGGNGRDAVWLARQGHTVTIVDPSMRMLKKAQALIAGKPDEVAARIALVQGTDLSAVKHFGENHFDVVLSHGVLMYQVEQPEQHVRQLLRLVKPGGLVSLLTKGKDGTIFEYCQRPEPDEAAIGRLVSTGQYVNNLGLEAIAFDAADISRMLHYAGARVLDWSGVRIASDYLNQSVASFGDKMVDKIISYETKLAHDPATRDLGQMLHFIARRDA